METNRKVDWTREEEYILIEASSQAAGDVLRGTTGGGPNEAGEVEDEDILILSRDKEITTSVTERVSQMLSSTPVFTGISRNIDLFQRPTTLLPPQTEIIEASAATPVFEGPEVTVSSRPVGKLKRRGALNSQII